MDKFTKEGYITFCRDRALRLLRNKSMPLSVVMNLLSDLRSHPLTRNHAAISAAHKLMEEGKLRSVESVKAFVERVLND